VSTIRVSSAFKWSGKQFNESSQVNGLGKCSILDGTAIPRSHHSRRLFCPQSSLKKASHEKDLTGLHHHASSPTTGIVTLSPFVCGMFLGVGGLDARYTGTSQVAARLVSWRFPVFRKLASFNMSWSIDHYQKRIDWCQCSRLVSTRRQVHC